MVGKNPSWGLKSEIPIELAAISVNRPWAVESMEMVRIADLPSGEIVELPMPTPEAVNVNVDPLRF